MTTNHMRFSASPDAIETTRNNFITGCDARRNRERHFPDNASIMSFLSREVKAWEKCDAFTLAYAAAHGINPASLYLHERHGGEMFNIYAMPKVRFLMRVLNGARITSLSDSDAATSCGTIAALAAGITGGKALANDVNDYMNGSAGRKGYASGATQSGSTLRALEALGIVAKDGARAWQIVDAGAFMFLHDAVKEATDTGGDAE